MSDIAELPVCTHRPTCPGCPRYGEPGISSSARHDLLRLAREAGAELDATRTGEPMGHRLRARLMVRGRATSPKIGLFQAASHRIADIPRCHVHHPLINRAAREVRDALRATGTPPYADAPHRGLVRALQVVVERSSRRLQLVVVTNDRDAASATPLLDALQDRLAPHLHSLWWNGNPERTNTILGAHWRAWRGPEAVRERIGGADVFFPPGAFGQSHLALFDRIVASVHASVEPGMRVVELHAGCGAIGLGLAARGHEVAFNELHPAGLRGLALGIAALPEPLRGRATCLAGPAGEQRAALAAADLVIVDPPRRGLEPRLREQLRDQPPARLLYLSCDRDSLMRDARELLDGARLRMRRLSPYALFPFTEHVETLAVFERP